MELIPKPQNSQKLIRFSSPSPVTKSFRSWQKSEFWNKFLIKTKAILGISIAVIFAVSMNVGPADASGGIPGFLTVEKTLSPLAVAL